MGGGFKYYILILVLESAVSSPTYNGELLTGEYDPSQEQPQYSYIWNGQNGPLQPGFPSNAQVQPQYEIQSSSYKPSYGQISFGQYPQIGVPVEQQLVNQQPDLRQPNVIIRPDYGPISSVPIQQLTDRRLPRNTGNGQQLQLANQQGNQRQPIGFNPAYNYGTIPSMQQYRQQQFANPQTQQILPNGIVNYAMQKPQVYSPPGLVQSPVLNTFPTSYGIGAQYRPLSVPIIREQQNNNLKTLPLVSATPQLNQQPSNSIENRLSNVDDIENRLINVDDIENRLNNVDDIENRLNNVDDIENKLSNVDKNKDENEASKSKSTNLNSTNVEPAINMEAVKQLYDYLNSQFEKNNSWPDFNIKQVLARNPEIQNALKKWKSSKPGDKQYIVIHADGTLEHVGKLETVAEKFPDYILVKPDQYSNTTSQLYPVNNAKNNQTSNLTKAVAKSALRSTSSAEAEVKMETEETYPHYEIPPTLDSSTDQGSSSTSATEVSESSATEVSESSATEVSESSATEVSESSAPEVSESNANTVINSVSKNETQTTESIPTLDEIIGSINNMTNTLISKNEGNCTKIVQNDKKVNSTSEGINPLDDDLSQKKEVINKKLTEKLGTLSDELLKFLFMSSMVSQSTEDCCTDEKSKKPLVLLDTSDSNFWDKLLEDDTSTLVYFFQAPSKSDAEKTSVSEDTIVDS